MVVIFCNNEGKGEHFMSTGKTIGGALGAIIVLLVAQILAQLVASLFVLVKIPEGICNIIAGIIYVGLAFVLSELLGADDYSAAGAPFFSAICLRTQARPEMGASMVPRT